MVKSYGKRVRQHFHVLLVGISLLQQAYAQTAPALPCGAEGLNTRARNEAVKNKAETAVNVIQDQEASRLAGANKCVDDAIRSVQNIRAFNPVDWMGAASQALLTQVTNQLDRAVDRVVSNAVCKTAGRVPRVGTPGYVQSVPNLNEVVREAQASVDRSINDAGSRFSPRDTPSQRPLEQPALPARVAPPLQKSPVPATPAPQPRDGKASSADPAPAPSSWNAISCQHYGINCPK